MEAILGIVRIHGVRIACGFFDASYSKFATRPRRRSGSMDRYGSFGGVSMNSNRAIFPGNDGKKQDELTAPTSRFTDEKISEESCTESQLDSALKPAGLANPFWK
jgi:hypothetical protein